MERRKFLAVAASIPALTTLESLRRAYATTLPSCAPNSNPCLMPQIWNADHDYDLVLNRLVSSTGKEKKQIRVSGDYLSISHDDMPSLERQPDGPAPNVERLVFDGREVHLKCSIAITQGSVSIYSKTLFLNEGGMISLFGDRNLEKSKLLIVCETLVLPDSRYEKPINIFYDDKGVGPSIEIYAEHLVRNGKTVDHNVEGAVWQTVGASDVLDVPPAGATTIVLGVIAPSKAADIWLTEVRWPANVYAKALRFHAANPFSSATTDVIEAAHAQVQPIIGRTSLPQVASGFPILVGLTANGLDAYGHRASWAPRKSLMQQRDDLQTTIVAFSSGLSEDLITIISSAYSDGVLVLGQLNGLQNKQAQLETQLINVDRQIADEIDKSKRLKIDFETIKISVTNAQSRIARATLDEQQRAKDGATARQGFTIVGTVAGIATSFYAGPAAGAGVATGFQVAGNLVYAHNTSGIDLKSLGEIIEHGTAFYKQMTEVFDGWEKFTDAKDQFTRVRAGDKILKGDPPSDGKPDNRKPYTETQAAQEAGSALSVFGKSFGAVISSLKAEVPQPISLSEKEKMDPQLQELLEHLSTNQRTQSEALATLQTLVERKASTDSSITEIREAINTLLTVKPENDRSRAQWVDRARYVWLSLIRDLVGQIYILQRAFFFETGSPLPIRSDILNFPGSLLSSIDAQSIDILAPGTAVTTTDVHGHLIETRRQLLLSANVVLGAVRSGIDGYLAKHQAKASFQQAVEFRRNDNDANRRAFVAAINAQIAILLARRKGGYALTKALGPMTDASAKDGSPAQSETSRAVPKLLPLYIPFLLPRPTSPLQSPQRFIQAQVVKVVWRDSSTNIGSDGLNLWIIHPGYGEIVGNGSQRFFDLRDGDANNEIRQATTAYMLAEGQGLQSRNVANVLGENYYTYYPARTDYYLEVEITSDNWGRLPEIDEIVIAWEFFQ